MLTLGATGQTAGFNIPVDKFGRKWDVDRQWYSPPHPWRLQDMKGSMVVLIAAAWDGEIADLHLCIECKSSEVKKINKHGNKKRYAKLCTSFHLEDNQKDILKTVHLCHFGGDQVCMLPCLCRKAMVTT